MRWRTASGTFASLSWPRLKSSSALVSVLCSPSPRRAGAGPRSWCPGRARQRRASAPSASRWKHRPAVRKGAPGKRRCAPPGPRWAPVVLPRRAEQPPAFRDQLPVRCHAQPIGARRHRKRGLQEAHCLPHLRTHARRGAGLGNEGKGPRPRPDGPRPLGLAARPGPATEESGDRYVGLLPDHDIRLDMDWDHRAGNRLSADSRHSVPSPVPTNLVPLFRPHHQRRHLHIHRRHQLVDRAFFRHRQQFVDLGIRQFAMQRQLGGQAVDPLRSSLASRTTSTPTDSSGNRAARTPSASAPCSRPARYRNNRAGRGPRLAAAAWPAAVHGLRPWR